MGKLVKLYKFQKYRQLLIFYMYLKQILSICKLELAPSTSKYFYALLYIQNTLVWMHLKEFQVIRTFPDLNYAVEKKTKTKIPTFPSF